MVNFRPKWVDKEVAVRSSFSPPHALQDWHTQTTEIHVGTSALASYTRSREARRFHLQFLSGYRQNSEGGLTGQQGRDGWTCRPGQGYHKYSMSDSTLPFASSTDKKIIVRANEQADAHDKLSDEEVVAQVS